MEEVPLKHHEPRRAVSSLCPLHSNLGTSFLGRCSKGLSTQLRGLSPMFLLRRFFGMVLKP